MYCTSHCAPFPYSAPQVVVDSNPSLSRPPVGPVEMVSVVMWSYLYGSSVQSSRGSVDSGE